LIEVPMIESDLKENFFGVS